jgi:hypothetical protein
MHSTNSDWDRFSIKLFSDVCFISRKCDIIYFSLLKSWRYPVGWIFFSLPKSSRYPWRPCSWNPKKKNCGKTGAPYGFRRDIHHDQIMIFVISSWSHHDLDHQILLKKGHLVINVVISWSRRQVFRALSKFLAWHFLTSAFDFFNSPSFSKKKTNGVDIFLFLCSPPNYSP